MMTTSTSTERMPHVTLPPRGSRALSSRSSTWRNLDWLGVGLGAVALLSGRSRALRGRAPWVETLGSVAVAAGGLHLLYGTRPRSRADHVRTTIRINRSPQELYRFWRELKNLPRFMQGVDSVETSSNGRSFWRGTAPRGRSLEWEMELIADDPQRRIAWCSLSGGDVFLCGSVRFEPVLGNRGTLVRIDQQSAWPTSGVLERWKQRFGGAEHRVKEDLRRFKQLMETGEVATTDGQSSGRTRKTIH